jgi:hypothetical protein
MEKISIIPNKIKVTDFNIRDKSVNLKLFFKIDSKEPYEDSIEWKTTFENNDLEAHKISVEIRKKVKHKFRENQTEMPIIAFDESDIQNKIVKFLSRTRHLAEQVFVTNTSDGYLVLIDKLKQTEEKL